MSFSILLVGTKEVIETIRSTRDRKAAGPDGIFNEHLKTTLPYHASTWSLLFNK
jgi:hypothetical protein